VLEAGVLECRSWRFRIEANDPRRGPIQLASSPATRAAITASSQAMPVLLNRYGPGSGETASQTTPAMGTNESLRSAPDPIAHAALIVFFAFATMGAAGATDVQVLATGLAGGILLDALVVRTLLVPATVSLLGRWNWWLPEPARRLMRIPAP
jgi:MMPL family protein